MDEQVGKVGDQQARAGADVESACCDGCCSPTDAAGSRESTTCCEPATESTSAREQGACCGPAA